MLVVSHFNYLYKKVWILLPLVCLLAKKKVQLEKVKREKAPQVKIQ